MQKVKKKVLLVTGASRGIGRSIIKYFAKTGEDLLLVGTYRSEAAAAESVRQDLASQGIQCEMIRCDVSDRDQVKALFEEIGSRYGRLDGLVNNAGITADGSFIQSTDGDIRKIIDTNLKGAIYCSHGARRLLEESRGAVVMVSSIAAVKGKEGQALYSATKGAVLGLTRFLAREWGPLGVRVNAVAPGFINTDMVAQLEPEMYRHVLRGTTVNRIGEPEEVAGVVHFLMSPASSYINGTVLPVDGGLQK